jgi:copper chaperone CopZ
MSQEQTGAETVTLAVTGMSCGGCAERISRVLERLPGVAVLAADHQHGTIAVQLESGHTTLDELQGRIEQLGYGVTR